MMLNLAFAIGGFLFGVSLAAFCYMAREGDEYKYHNPHPPNCPECGKFMKRVLDDKFGYIWQCQCKPGKITGM